MSNVFVTVHIGRTRSVDSYMNQFTSFARFFAYISLRIFLQQSNLCCITAKLYKKKIKADVLASAERLKTD